MTEIIEPSDLDNDRLKSQYRVALNTVEKMRGTPSKKDIILDLTAAEWFTPTFLVPVSVVISKLMNKGKNVDVRYPISHGVSSYLNMIDFPTGTTNPSEEFQNILPLFSIDTTSDENAIEAVDSKMRDLIRNQFMSEVDKVNWLQYPFGEIIDNVDTHSKCNFGALLIQNYPQKQFLDFCIADDGISIPGSYEEFGTEFDSDEDAIRMALEEGVSTRPDTGGKRGYGLRTTAEMICSGLDGQVLLSSRETTVFRDGNHTKSNDQKDIPWKGTVFAARVYPPSEDFSYLDYMSPD